MEYKNNLIEDLSFDTPDISPDTKNQVAKNISTLETKINTALLSPSSLSVSAFNEIEKLLAQTEKLYHDMEVELASYSQKTKDKYNLGQFKSKISQLKGNLKELESLSIEKKSSDDFDDEAKEQLISSNAALDEGNRKMAESIKIMHQVNQTDKNTMQSLKNQTNIIMNSSQLLNEAEAYIRKSGQILSSMINKALADKIILITIIILLGLINVMLIYYKIKK